MKILFLTTHLNVGGVTSYLFTLGRGLKAKGHQVYIASDRGDCLSQFSREGIVHLCIPIRTKCEASPKVLFSFFRLLKIIKENKIEIIHANTRVTQVLACLVSSFSGKPYVTTCHGFFKKRFFRMAFPCWGDRVIAISQQVKDHLINDFRFNEKKIRLIHHGIDAARFKSIGKEDLVMIKNKLGLKGGPVVGIIARLSDVKGHCFLIEAMQHVAKEIPESQLLIVGEGREEQKLKDLCRKLNLAENIRFIPSLKGTQEALSIMDLFVMPSLKEGLGLGLMEAMSSGLAVIGSDVGGIKTLIKHGVNGVLVQPADKKGLAEAILELLRDEDRRRDLGNGAREFILNNFPLQDMIEQTERVYQECPGLKK